MLFACSGKDVSNERSVAEAGRKKKKKTPVLSFKGEPRGRRGRGRRAGHHNHNNGHHRSRVRADRVSNDWRRRRSRLRPAEEEEVDDRVANSLVWHGIDKNTM